MVAPLAIAGIGMGLGAIGSAISGGQAAGASRYQTEQDFLIRQEQNKISRGGLDLQKTMGANDLRRQLESSGLRDRTLFALQNRTGMTPGQFRPKDMFNPSQGGQSPQQGGIDFAQLSQQNQQFTPGAGGANPEMLRQMLAKLGFGGGGAPSGGGFRGGGGGGGGGFSGNGLDQEDDTIPGRAGIRRM